MLDKFTKDVERHLGIAASKPTSISDTLNEHLAADDASEGHDAIRVLNTANLASADALTKAGIEQAPTARIETRLHRIETILQRIADKVL